MNTDKTEIITVLDRSGSMANIKSDMEGGYDTFIEKQKAEPGECLVTLYQFDTFFDAVYEAKPIGDVPKLEIIPRGGTALLDAVGRSLALTIERHAALEEKDRPAAVVFIIITDGQENSSVEWTKDKIKVAIKDAEDNRKWQMVFLAANASAFEGAVSYGFKGGKMSAMKRGSLGIRESYGATSSAVRSYRSAVSSGASGQDLSLDSSAFGKSKPEEDND